MAVSRLTTAEHGRSHGRGRCAACLFCQGHKEPFPSTQPHRSGPADGFFAMPAHYAGMLFLPSPAP